MTTSSHFYLIPVPLAENTRERAFVPGSIELLTTLDVFLVENIRTARRTISGLKLGRVIDQITFLEVNKDTPDHLVLNYLKLYAGKKDIGFMSEAGCPGVADPGAVATKFAHQLGYKVSPLVGPSSILLALMGSGFNGQSFAFNGYLPIDKAERKRSIGNLERLATSGTRQTQLFMETPFRNNQLLDAILETGRSETLLCIACNLTSAHESVQTKSIGDWKKNKPDLHKKPVIFGFGSV